MRNRLRLGIFLKVHRLERWFRARFTPLGRALLGALVAVGLFALNPRITQAWLLAIVVLTVILVAMIQAPLFRPRLRLRRLLPAYATAGLELQYPVLVENTSRRTLPECQLKDRPPRLRARDLIAEPVAGSGWETVSNASGYAQFVRWIRLRDGFRGQRGDCGGIAPGHQARLWLSLLPLRRGYLNLSRLCLQRTDPLGIFRAWQEQAVDDRLLVLPRRYPLHWRDSSGRNRRSGSGRAQSSSTGGSVDFARLREYRQGDPMRHIHWRAWAHLGTPVVMEFHQQTPGRSALIMDTFAGRSCDRDTFEEAVSVAASFCGDGRWCDGRLELLLLGDQPVRLGYGPEGGDRNNAMEAMLEALACVQPAAEHSPELLARAARRELEGIDQCICVFLDFDAAHQALVRELRLNGIHLLVLVVHATAAERIGAADPKALGAGPVVAVAPGEAARVLADLPAARLQMHGAISA